MYQRARALFKTSISSPSFWCSSKLSPQSVTNILPFISNASSPSTKQYSPSYHTSTLFFPFRRKFCSGQQLDYTKEVDEINLKFAEAREEIDAALESKETVYFDEEAECAREAVKSVFDMFEGLLAKLPEKESSFLQRSMGLKMEQLKAEIKQLED